MAVALVAGSVVSQGGNGVGWTTVVNVGSASLFMSSPVCIGAAVSSIVYAGANLTQLIGPGGQNIGIWYKNGPASGSNNWTTTFASYVWGYSHSMAWTGTDPTTPFGSTDNVSGSGNGGGTAAGNSLTCPAGGIVYGCMYSGYLSGQSAPTSQNTPITTNHNNGGTMGAAYRQNSGAMSWVRNGSGGPSGWQVLSVPINAVADNLPPSSRTIMQATTRSSRY